MEKKKGLLFVISGPSGCGKTTLGKRILSQSNNLWRSVSVTTRPMRRGERNGKEYFFVKEKEFREMREKGKFLEWANTFGYFYGTPRQFVLENIKKGKDVILIIDVQGAMQVKKKFPQAIFIFIAPPSRKALRERMRKRSVDSPSEIKRRLLQAEKEMNYQNQYDYILINDDLDIATKILKAIITLERIKRR